VTRGGGQTAEQTPTMQAPLFRQLQLPAPQPLHRAVTRRRPTRTMQAIRAVRQTRRQHAAACHKVTHASCCSAWLLRLTWRDRSATHGNPQAARRAAAGRRWERRSTDLEINCTDTSATLSDAATLNDATCNNATHNALPTPPTTQRPYDQRERRLEGSALSVCFIPKSQTCNIQL
jgi:hypothetical protein